MIDPNTIPEFNEDDYPLEDASEEEEALLAATMDSVEDIIHGAMRDKVIQMLDSTPELFQSVSQAATMLIERVSHKMDEQQIENDGSIFFGVNGAIQQTVELLWEMAEAMGHPASQDDDQLAAAYMATLANLGEHMMEDEESAREAQAYLIDQELGFDATDQAADELEMLQGGDDIYMHEGRSMGGQRHGDF